MKILFKNKVYIILVLILILSSVLRFYKIGIVPPSLTWDEAAVGYNALSIANYGKDEYGKFFPLYFRSFGEDKQPVHIYITAIFIKLFGLSEFTIRLPAAIFGTLNVLLLFFLAKTLFRNEYIGLTASLFLAISPQNIHFSRFNHEANFALFFFMLGLLFFLKSLKEWKYFLPFSILFFFLSMITYHTAEIVVPLVGILLAILYFKQLKQYKNSLLITVILVIFIIFFGFHQPRLFGINRFNQTTQGNADIERTEVFKITHNYLLGRINLVLMQYSYHFSPKFLFISGDKNPRLSSQGAGEFYIIDSIFLIIGVLYLIKKRSKENILILGWALVGPLPSSLFAEAPHAGRATFMMGSWHLIAALGCYYLISFFKKAILKWFTVSICVIILFMSLGNYFINYITVFPKRYSIDWQYGMKQIVEYVNKHNEFTNIVVTDARSQPYIFFLYYLQTPLPTYLNTVIYNNSESRSYNNVVNFEKYYFGGGDLIESNPEKGILYVLTPSQYDGLRYKSSFDVSQRINYPNGTVAFYLVNGKK